MVTFNEVPFGPHADVNLESVESFSIKESDFTDSQKADFGHKSF